MGSLLAVFFMLMFDNFDWATFLLLFITYFAGYAYDEFQYTKYFKKIVFWGFIGGVISISIMVLNEHYERVLRWSMICLVGLLYDSFFLKHNFRKIPFFKIFYVGLTWGLMNAWLIAPSFDIPVFIITVLFISALILPFDIHDMEKDRGIVLTFPLKYGESTTRILAVAMMLLSLVIAYFNFDGLFLISYSATIIITCVMIYGSKYYKRNLYYSFGLESCSAFPLLFYFIFSYL